MSSLALRTAVVGLALFLGQSLGSPYVLAQPGNPLGGPDKELAGILVPHQAPPEPADVAIAGLPAGSNPVRLTWQHIYTLAVIRSRSEGQAALSESLDLKAVSARAKELFGADLSGFRKSFLDDARFEDPTRRIFDLTADYQAIELAWKEVAAAEQLVLVYRELIKGESSGLTQRQLDRTDIARQDRRLRLSDLLTRYRESLDALKLSLGLSSHAQIVLDTAPVKPFREVFDAAGQWQRNPARRLDEIPGLASRLPVLEDVVIRGRSLLAQSRVALELDRPEVLFQSAMAVLRPGKQSVPAEPGRREVILRQTIRSLIRDARDYEIERRLFELTMRQADTAFDEVIAPPDSEPRARKPIADATLVLLAANHAVVSNRQRLVALWCRYQAGRISLLRMLGEFPFTDWNALERSLSPLPGLTKVAPAAAPAPPAPLPLPVPPPGR